jgi:hypothetical protein
MACPLPLRALSSTAARSKVWGWAVVAHLFAHPLNMNKIILKHTGVPDRKPQNLALGELAINAEDGVLFFRAPSGKMHEIKVEQHDPNLLDQVNRYLLFFLLVHWLAATVGLMYLVGGG